MSTYFDSAVLVKAYCLEATTREALTLIAKATPPLPFTYLHNLEIRNALRLKRHRKELTESQLRGAVQDLEEDVTSGFLQAPDHDLRAVYDQAELLSAAYTVLTGARSLDILHVTAAVIVEADEFASFDRRQRSVAARAGLRVLPRSLPASS